MGLLALEFLLYELALVLFTHLDSPDCPGSDAFCTPDGTVLEGGTIVVLLGNAVILTAAVATVLATRRAASHRAAVLDREG